MILLIFFPQNFSGIEDGAVFATARPLPSGFGFSFNDTGQAGAHSASHVAIHREPCGEPFFEGAVANGFEHGVGAAGKKFQALEATALRLAVFFRALERFEPRIERIGDEAFGSE